MKKISRLNRYAAQGILSVGMLTLLAGCVDDNYDFGDDNFDNTMQLQVKDLTIPLNLAPVSFGSLVDLKSDIIDDSTGEYVFHSEGEFASNPIEVAEINATTTSERNYCTMDLPAVVSGYSVTLPVDETFDFSYEYAEVSSYIRDIKSAKVDFVIDVMIETDADINIKNAVFQMPKGTQGMVVDKNLSWHRDSSDPTIIYIDELTKNNLGKYSFAYAIDYINLTEAGGKLIPDPNFDEGKFELHNALRFISADVEGLSNSTNNTLEVSIGFGDIYVDAIAGTLQIEDIETDAELTDLPKELTNRSTRIGLQDPKIYLTIYDTMNENRGIVATAGVSIKQIRHDEEYYEPESARELTLDPGTELSIEGNGSVHNFVLGNIANDPAQGEYNLENVEYLIYGKGMPDALQIVFTNPTFTADEDHMFNLGIDMDPFTGDYNFEAPLAFTSGSQVVFSQEQDGWAISEDDSLDIKHFDITASVKSNLPVGVEFKAYPIQLDASGRRYVNRNIKLTCDPIPPMADIADYHITIDGEITQIDGMEYEVTINSDGGDDVLSPDQSIEFSNIRVKISGNYTINNND